MRVRSGCVCDLASRRGLCEATSPLALLSLDAGSGRPPKCAAPYCSNARWPCRAVPWTTRSGVLRSARGVFAVRLADRERPTIDLYPYGGSFSPKRREACVIGGGGFISGMGLSRLCLFSGQTALSVPWGRFHPASSHRLQASRQTRVRGPGRWPLGSRRDPHVGPARRRHLVGRRWLLARECREPLGTFSACELRVVNNESAPPLD